MKTGWYRRKSFAVNDQVGSSTQESGARRRTTIMSSCRWVGRDRSCIIGLDPDDIVIKMVVMDTIGKITLEFFSDMRVTVFK